MYTYFDFYRDAVDFCEKNENAKIAAFIPKIVVFTPKEMSREGGQRRQKE